MQNIDCSFQIKYYGLFLVGLSLEKPSLTRHCLIQVMEDLSVDDEIVTNEFDCPLYTLSNNFCCISPEAMLTPVSFVHQCNQTCKFVHKSSSLNIERESVDQSSVCFEHDWSNDLYCLNVFCINQ